MITIIIIIIIIIIIVIKNKKNKHFVSSSYLFFLIRFPCRLSSDTVNCLSCRQYLLMINFAPLPSAIMTRLR